MAETVATKDLYELASLGRVLKGIPFHRLTLRYDAEADVLYVKFVDSAPIHRSELTEDDFLIEYDAHDKLVGVTILEVSTRTPMNAG